MLILLIAAALPVDVANFVDRRMACNHWAGEEPYDKARAHEIERAVRRLRCETLDAEEVALHRLHAGDSKVEKALKASRDAF